MPARRLLFLAPFAPRLDAGHGGGRAMAGLLSGLAERNQVALLYLRGDGEPGIDDELRGRLEIVEEFPRFGRNRAVGLWRRIHKQARAAAALVSWRPTWATHCAVPALAARLREMVRDWRPDVVQAEYHVMGQYLEDVHGARRVLNQYEPGAPAALELWRSSRGLDRLRNRLDLWAWERFERRVMALADAVVVFTDRDREAMAPYTGSVPVVTIPLGTELPEHPLDAAGRPPLEVLFFGNFNHPPNVDAAVRLARSIFPRVQERRPDAALTLVGESPPKGLARRGIEVTGFVSSLGPYLDRAAVVAAPLFQGGGMRVKILEALAAGKAVVATPLAVEGIGVRDGREVILARTDGEFAQAITNLLEERERRISLAHQARSWAEENLGWRRTVEAYEALYERLSPPSPGEVKVTVAVATLDRPDALARCLDALTTGEVLPDEILVVDQGTDERTRAVAESRGAVWLRQERRGLAASRNLALEQASCPILVVTDDDCVPAPGWVAAVRRAFSSPSVPDAPDAITGPVQPLGPETPGLFAVSSRTSGTRAEFQGRALPWLVGTGGNFAARRERVERAGGWDGRLGAGSAGGAGEDMDLLYRLLRSGARIRYEPEAVVFHERQPHERRLASRSSYGRGIGACVGLWLREGDLHALRVLGRWISMRAGLTARALRRGRWEALREEGLVLGGTLGGLLYGLRGGRA